MKSGDECEDKWCDDKNGSEGGFSFPASSDKRVLAADNSVIDWRIVCACGSCFKAERHWYEKKKINKTPNKIPRQADINKN